MVTFDLLTCLIEYFNRLQVNGCAGHETIVYKS